MRTLTTLFITMLLVLSSTIAFADNTAAGYEYEQNTNDEWVVSDTVTAYSWATTKNGDREITDTITVKPLNDPNSPYFGQYLPFDQWTYDNWDPFVTAVIWSANSQSPTTMRGCVDKDGYIIPKLLLRQESDAVFASRTLGDIINNEPIPSLPTTIAYSFFATESSGMFNGYNPYEDYNLHELMLFSEGLPEIPDWIIDKNPDFVYFTPDGNIVLNRNTIMTNPKTGEPDTAVTLAYELYNLNGDLLPIPNEMYYQWETQNIPSMTWHDVFYDHTYGRSFIYAEDLEKFTPRPTSTTYVGRYVITKYENQETKILDYDGTPIPLTAENLSIKPFDLPNRLKKGVIKKDIFGLWELQQTAH